MSSGEQRGKQRRQLAEKLFRDALALLDDDHRDEYRVKPICDVLPIAPSTYYRHRAQRRRPCARVDCMHVCTYY